MSNYPKTRAKKIQRAGIEKEWFNNSYTFRDFSGHLHRKIDGICEICDKPQTMRWANFRVMGFKFRHLKCAQSFENGTRTEFKQARSAFDVSRMLYSKYKKNAEKHNRAFELTSEEFYKLIISNCFYCNAIPIRPFDDYDQLLYNGIDRKNNKFGYTLDNSVACCTRCNFFKGAVPYEEWILFITEVSYFNRGI